MMKDINQEISKNAFNRRKDTNNNAELKDNEASKEYSETKENIKNESGNEINNELPKSWLKQYFDILTTNVDGGHSDYKDSCDSENLNLSNKSNTRKQISHNSISDFADMVEKSKKILVKDSTESKFKLARSIENNAPADKAKNIQNQYSNREVARPAGKKLPPPPKFKR